MNILIVDDEPAVIQIIRKVINWEQAKIDHVFTANNVPCAKQILQSNSVDIILCDIEMSRENGLDLMKWIQEQNLSIEKLLLTSYKSFEYAQTAISLGISEYILKPVKYAELQQTIEKAGKRIQQLRKKEHYRKYGEYIGTVQNPIYDFFEDLVSEKIFSIPHLIKEEILNRELALDFDSQYTLIWFSGTDRSNIEKLGKRSFFYLQNIAENLFSNTVYIPFERDILFILDSSISEGQLQNLCHVYMEKINEVLKHSLSAYVIQNVDMTHLSESSDYLIEMAKYYNSSGQEIFYADEYNYTSQFSESSQKINIEYSASETDIVSQIMKYINTHLEDTIDREHLESLVHLNKDYLNRLFKKATGHTIMHYIQLCRIEKAKQLLCSENSANITSICMQIGFNSPAYFTKVFKRQTGFSPSEYRNLQVCKEITATPNI